MKYISDLRIEQNIGEVSVSIRWKNPNEPFDSIRVYRKELNFYNNPKDSTATLIYILHYSENLLNTYTTIVDDDIQGNRLYHYTVAVVEPVTSPPPIDSYAPIHPTLYIGLTDKNEIITKLSMKSVIVINLFGFEKIFYELMPDKDIEFDSNPMHYHHLKKFIKVIAKFFEHMYARVKTLEFITDISKTTPEFVKIISEMLNWETDDRIPIDIQKMLLENAIYFYKWSGTKKAVIQMAKALGNHEVEIIEGNKTFNLFIIDSTSNLSVEILKKYINKVIPIDVTYNVYNKEAYFSQFFLDQSYIDNDFLVEVVTQ